MAQPLMVVVPVFVMVMSVVKPPGHGFDLYVTLQPTAGWLAVVTATGAEAGEATPAVSRASTVNWYAVAAVRPVTASVRVVASAVLPTRVDVVPLTRYTSYLDSGNDPAVDAP